MIARREEGLEIQMKKRSSSIWVIKKSSLIELRFTMVLERRMAFLSMELTEKELHWRRNYPDWLEGKAEEPWKRKSDMNTEDAMEDLKVKRLYSIPTNGGVNMRRGGMVWGNDGSRSI